MQFNIKESTRQTYVYRNY